MEKNHKSHKKSSYTISLGDSTKNKHCNKGCESSSSDDEESKKKCKKRCCKTGPPGPLVTTFMASSEFEGLDPNYEGTYCILPECNNKYLLVGSYITIHCTSENTPYFLITAITSCYKVITIKNINDETATWENGAKVALVGPRGAIGATGTTLFGVTSVSEVSWNYGATLINNDGFISLQLGPADNVNPGLLTATDQLIAGTKYFQDVIVAANFDDGPTSTWGGYNPGSMYYDTGLNALQLYLGATIGDTYSGSTWCSVLTDCSGFNLNGVTSLGATGLPYGATFTGDGYLQFAYAIGGGTTNTPGLMPGSYSDIFSSQGCDLTTNFGQNWIQTTNSAIYWNSISMSSSGQYQTACENISGGSLFVSTDFGKNWTQLASTVGYEWKYVSISSSGRYQSAINYDGSNYNIQVSSEYGGNATWSYTGLTTTQILTCISISASGQYQTACADTSGSIWISSDYGNNWSEVVSTSGNEWKSVSVSSSGQYQTACIYDVANYIYTSSDYGNTWVINSYNPVNGYVTSVSLSGSGQYQSICTSVGGRIYISNDYGNTWGPSVGSPTNANLVSIAVSASGQYQVVAQQANGSYTGCIFTSSDYGNSWSSNNNAPNDVDLNIAPWSGVAISASGQYIAGVLLGLYIWNCQNSISNGVVSVGNYSLISTPGITGVAGSIYYDTDDTVLKFSDGSAWTSVKSFVIDHPKDQEKLLVHGCLEGPEAGVYYRGKGVITNNESVIIELPDYVDKLAKNLTVQLTPIYDGNIYKPQYFATEVSGNKFKVHGVNGAFYWTVYGERLSFIVEPNKNEVEIKGDGPYKWL